MKNQKGFVHLHTLFIVIFIMMIVFSIAFVGAVIQIQQEIRSECLKESVAIQKDIIHAEKILLQMNIASTSLRVSYYAAVAVSLFPPTAAVGQAQMRAIQTLRQNLDRAQKLLIRVTETKARIESLGLLARLNQLSWKKRQIWNFYLSLFSYVRLHQTPKMAVHALSSDLAPNYELDNDYKRTQRLELFWQTFFQTKSSAQKILDYQGSLSLTCGAIPERKGNQWSIEIIADKF